MQLTVPVLIPLTIRPAGETFWNGCMLALHSIGLNFQKESYP